MPLALRPGLGGKTQFLQLNLTGEEEQGRTLQRHCTMTNGRGSNRQMMWFAVPMLRHAYSWPCLSLWFSILAYPCVSSTEWVQKKTPLPSYLHVQSTSTSILLRTQGTQRRRFTSTLDLMGSQVARIVAAVTTWQLNHVAPGWRLTDWAAGGLGLQEQWWDTGKLTPAALGLIPTCSLCVCAESVDLSEAILHKVSLTLKDRAKASWNTCVVTVKKLLRSLFSKMFVRCD